MGAYVGVTFAIDGVNTARRFKIWRTSNSLPYWASNTQQGAGRKCGNVDWRGRYWCYGHTPVHFPGDSFTFQCVTDNGKGLQGSAIVERMQVFWNIQRGGYIWYIVEFARNGALTLSGTATDNTQPAAVGVFCAQGTKFTYSGTTLSDVTEMKLDVRAYNRPRVTSDTAGGVLRARGNLDAFWDVKSLNEDPSAYPTINTNHALRFYVDSTTYWAMNWGRVLGSPNDFGANHEDLSYVEATTHGRYNGHLASGTGSIVNPAGTTEWPYT
jgi:hypothetical protein